jgi:dTDP-4-amino-4,6-dideoxygalactose transaminase
MHSWSTAITTSGAKLKSQLTIRCETSLTGVGLKNRAHPLAIAIALDQLRKIPKILATKRKFAVYMAARLSAVPFLKVPDLEKLEKDAVLPSWYGFIMHFDGSAVRGKLTRDAFVDALHREGLQEVDIPRSTGLLHHEPLFSRPWVVLPHLYTQQGYSRTEAVRAAEKYPKAQELYDTAIKLPVWGFEEDSAIVEEYMDGIIRISSQWVKQELVTCAR